MELKFGQFQQRSEAEAQRISPSSQSAEFQEPHGFWYNVTSHASQSTVMYSEH